MYNHDITKHPYDTTLPLDVYKEQCKDIIQNGFLSEFYPYQHDFIVNDTPMHRIVLNDVKINNTFDIVAYMETQGAKYKYFVKWFYTNPFETVEQAKQYIDAMGTNQPPMMYLFAIDTKEAMQMEMPIIAKRIYKITDATAQQNWENIYQWDFCNYMDDVSLNELYELYINMPLDHIEKHTPIMQQMDIFSFLQDVEESQPNDLWEKEKHAIADLETNGNLDEANNILLDYYETPANLKNSKLNELQNDLQWEMETKANTEIVQSKEHQFFNVFYLYHELFFESNIKTYSDLLNADYSYIQNEIMLCKKDLDLLQDVPNYWDLTKSDAQLEINENTILEMNFLLNGYVPIDIAQIENKKKTNIIYCIALKHYLMDAIERKEKRKKGVAIKLQNINIEGTAERYINDTISYFVGNNDLMDQMPQHNYEINYNASAPTTYKQFNSIVTGQLFGIHDEKQPPYYEIITPKGIFTTLDVSKCAEFSQKDLFFLQTICCFLDNGGFTLNQIFEFLAQNRVHADKNGKMPNLYNEIEQSIEYMRTHIIGIYFGLKQEETETEKEYRTRKNQTKKELQKNFNKIRLNCLYRANILPIESVEKIDRTGKKTIWYRFLNTPPIYMYNDAINRITSIPTRQYFAPFDKDLAQQKVNATSQNQLLNNFLENKINYFKHFGGGNIKCSAIYNAIGFDAEANTPKATQQLRDTIKKMLETYKKNGTIYDWKTIQKAHGQIDAYHIDVYPKKAKS